MVHTSAAKPGKLLLDIPDNFQPVPLWSYYFDSCESQMVLSIYSANHYHYYIFIYVSVYILETLGFGFDYCCKILRPGSLLVHCNFIIIISQIYKTVLSPNMLMRYFLSSVCLRLSQFPPLSFVRYIGLCVLSMSIFHDDCVNMCSLCNDHHQIESINHSPKH